MYVRVPWRGMVGAREVRKGQRSPRSGSRAHWQWSMDCVRAVSVIRSQDSKNIKAQQTNGMWAVQDVAEAAKKLNSRLEAAWDGTPFKITLLENLMTKLRAKLVLEALKGVVAVRKFRRELVTQQVSWLQGTIIELDGCCWVVGRPPSFDA